MSTLRLRLALALTAILGASGAVLAQDRGRADDHKPRFRIFVPGKAGMTIARALEGAIRRLSTPACKRLLDDFTDQTGRSLALSVAALRKSPADLLSALYFADGDDTIQCRTDETVAAFTEPGSRVVHVCKKRFEQFARNMKHGELLLIHEFLHALGLGENPPTRSRITNAVMNRCG